MTPKQIRIERLRQLQQERGLKGPVELGKLIGRKTNQTSDLLHGRAAFGEKVARSIEAFAGLPGGWLDQVAGLDQGALNGVGKMAPVALSRRGIGAGRAPNRSPAASASPPRSGPVAAAATDTLALRRLATFDMPGHVASGQAILLEPLSIAAAWARQLGASGNGESLCYMLAADDAMEPSMGAGDILIVDTGITECSRDGVYALRANGRDYVRRVRLRLDGQYEISADNPAIKSVDVVRSKQLQVLGKVLWGWRGHRF